MNTTIGSIYKITENATGKVYIGQTWNIPHRRAQYRHDAKSGRNTHRPIGRAIAGKDFDNEFTFEAIDVGYLTQDALDIAEKYWINKYNATNPEYGYNVSSGGDGSGKDKLSYTDKIRISVKSPKKRTMLIYDSERKFVLQAFSVASANEWLGLHSAESLASAARLLHRAKGGRYYLYYADIEYQMEFTRKIMKKRLDSIKNFPNPNFGPNNIILYLTEMLSCYVYDILPEAEALGYTGAEEAKKEILDYLDEIQKYLKDRKSPIYPSSIRDKKKTDYTYI